MSNLMQRIKDGELKKAELNGVDPLSAYVTLMLALLKEPMMSSISKGFVISSSFSYLKEAGYTDEQLKAFKSSVADIVNVHITINNFMG